MSSALQTPAFTSLSSHVLLYNPSLDHEHKHLVVLCPWLGASPRHIDKYALLVTRIAPTARILLLPSTLNTLFAPAFVIRRALRPAVAVVLEALAANNSSASGSSGKSTNVLIYAFSNGGGFSMVRLLRCLRAATGRPLAVSGLILDSCPGVATYTRSVKAMALALPFKSALLRAPFMAVIRILFALLSLLVRVGWQHPILRMREELLNADLIVGRRTEQGRASSGQLDAEASGGLKATYVYSKTDALVDWRDVEGHARAARSKGWDVQEAMIEGGAHCAHYLKQPELYEDVVRGMWERR